MNIPTLTCLQKIRGRPQGDLRKMSISAIFPSKIRAAQKTQTTPQGPRKPKLHPDPNYTPKPKLHPSKLTRLAYRVHQRVKGWKKCQIFCTPLYHIYIFCSSFACLLLSPFLKRKRTRPWNSLVGGFFVFIFQKRFFFLSSS